MTDSGEKKRSVLKIAGLGCGGCLIAILLMATVVAVIGGFVMQMIKTSYPYEEALERTRRSSRVVEKIGEPIQPGWLVLGSIETTGPSGEAAISIPVSGPTGRAKIFVEAEKSAGKWDLLLLQVEIRGHDRRVDLME